MTWDQVLTSVNDGKTYRGLGNLHLNFHLTNERVQKLIKTSQNIWKCLNRQFWWSISFSYLNRTAFFLETRSNSATVLMPFQMFSGKQMLPKYSSLWLRRVTLGFFAPNKRPTLSLITLRPDLACIIYVNRIWKYFLTEPYFTPKKDLNKPWKVM